MTIGFQVFEDRLTQALASVVSAFTSHTRYFAIYEYEVAEADETKVSARPTDKTLGLPECTDVPMVSATSGFKAKLTPGVKVLLAFVNGSPSRPVIVSSDASKPALEVTLVCTTSLTIDAPAFELNASGSVKVNSTSIELGGSGGLPVAHAAPLVTVHTNTFTMLTALNALAAGSPGPLTGAALGGAIAGPYGALASSMGNLSQAPSTTTKAV